MVPLTFLLLLLLLQIPWCEWRYRKDTADAYDI